MQLEKIFSEEQIGERKHIISYCTFEHYDHAVIILSRRSSNGLFYTVCSIGTVPASGKKIDNWTNRHCHVPISHILRNTRGEVIFEQLTSSSKDAITIYAKHYYISKWTWMKLYELMKQITNPNTFSQNIVNKVELEHDSTFTDFNLLKRNCHNFACIILGYAGIVDDLLVQTWRPLKVDKYTIHREVNQKVPANDKRWGFLTASSSKECYPTRYRWPQEMEIAESTMYTPDAELFSIAEGVSPSRASSQDELRLLKAKALLKDYNSMKFLHKRHFHKAVKKVLGMDYISEVSSLLNNLYGLLMTARNYPFIRGDLMKRIFYIDFLLNRDDADIPNGTEQQISVIDKFIERELYRLHGSHKLRNATEKIYKFYQAYLCNHNTSLKSSLTMAASTTKRFLTKSHTYSKYAGS
ncbi:hypothetical protein P0136_07740 [Lentisphaerota bacterium ZTH]|nr:hypothetical protein JYG24_01145 [Lentisphaerota bacterium]WET05257.1 hypothetical protein P0136_07740 [Lentisphaerota bacterium ZTH]